MLAIGNLLSGLCDHTVLPLTWTRYDAAALGNGSYFVATGVVDLVVVVFFLDDVLFFLDEEVVVLVVVLLFCDAELVEAAGQGWVKRKTRIRVRTKYFILMRQSSKKDLIM